MARLMAVCALPRLPATLAGVRGASDVVVVVALPAGQRASEAAVRPVHRILDASDVALALGIHPGQRIMDAQRLCPALRTVVIDERAVDDELMAIAERLLSLSPLVEPLPPSKRACLPLCCIAVDVTGLPRPRARLVGDLARALAQMGHPAWVALSSSKSLSMAIAKDSTARPQAWRTRLFDVFAAPIDDVRRRLELSALELDQGLVDSLRAAGVCTLDNLVPLVDQGLTNRLGPAAPAVLRLLRLTGGLPGNSGGNGESDDDSDGIKSPLQPVEVVGASRDLEYGVMHLEPLLFVLRPLVESILARLVVRRRRLLELSVALGARRRPPTLLSMTMAVPTVEASVVLRVLTTRLERAFAEADRRQQRRDRHSTGNNADNDTGTDDNSHLLSLGDDGVERVMLVARRTVDATPTQPGLIDGVTDAPPELLLHLVSELSASYGDDKVGCLTVTRQRLPEQMSALRWPPPKTGASEDDDDHAPPVRRRRPRPVVVDTRTSHGRFAAGWPWPLRLLPRPAPIPWSAADVESDRPFATLEGDDAHGPYRRRYREVTLHDGRRALVLVDDDAAAAFVHGWFD